MLANALWVQLRSHDTVPSLQAQSAKKKTETSGHRRISLSETKNPRRRAILSRARTCNGRTSVCPRLLCAIEDAFAQLGKGRSAARAETRRLLSGKLVEAIDRLEKKIKLQMVGEESTIWITCLDLRCAALSHNCRFCSYSFDQAFFTFMIATAWSTMYQSRRSF